MPARITGHLPVAVPSTQSGGPPRAQARRPFSRISRDRNPRPATLTPLALFHSFFEILFRYDNFFLPSPFGSAIMLLEMVSYGRNSGLAVETDPGCAGSFSYWIASRWRDSLPFPAFRILKFHADGRLL